MGGAVAEVEETEDEEEEEDSCLVSAGFKLFEERRLFLFDIFLSVR
jgi:hypothetical protein